MQKNETSPRTYTLHKKKLKMDKRLKCKSQNHKNPIRKQAAKSQTSPHSNMFADSPHRARETKEK